MMTMRQCDDDALAVLASVLSSTCDAHEWNEKVRPVAALLVEQIRYQAPAPAIRVKAKALAEKMRGIPKTCQRAAMSRRIAELELSNEMACIEPDPDCDCAGCTRADEHYGLKR